MNSSPAQQRLDYSMNRWMSCIPDLTFFLTTYFKNNFQRDFFFSCAFIFVISWQLIIVYVFNTKRKPYANAFRISISKSDFQKVSFHLVTWNLVSGSQNLGHLTGNRMNAQSISNDVPFQNIVQKCSVSTLVLTKFHVTR